MRRLIVKRPDGEIVAKFSLNVNEAPYNFMFILSDGSFSFGGVQKILAGTGYTVEVSEDTEAATGGGSSGG